MRTFILDKDVVCLPQPFLCRLLVTNAPCRSRKPPPPTLTKYEICRRDASRRVEMGGQGAGAVGCPDLPRRPEVAAQRAAATARAGGRRIGRLGSGIGEEGRLERLFYTLG